MSDSILKNKTNRKVAPGRDDNRKNENDNKVWIKSKQFLSLQKDI